MKGFRKSHAVVIGIDDYTNGIPPLQTAVNDARKIAELLRERFAYDAVEALTSDSGLVSKWKLEELFSKGLPGLVNEEDRLLIYFAGHGIALEGDDGPAGYLIPQDASRDDRKTFLAMTEVNGWLNALPCRHMLLVLDCCFAGAFRWSSTRDMGAAPQEIYKERYDRFIRDPAWQVLTSAAHDQKALDTLGERGKDSRMEGHSPFAAALIRGLMNEADIYPKDPGDGVITASELAMFLREKVERPSEAVGNRQTPMLWPLQKHDKGEYIHVIPGFNVDDLKPAPKLEEKGNPYRGLQSYDFEHASLFFGRKKVVERLSKRVEAQPLTLVLGASGTGKSSVAKAGLVHRLLHPPEPEDGTPPLPPTDWTIFKPIRPTNTPLASLAGLSIDSDAHPSNARSVLPIEISIEALKKSEAALAEAFTGWFAKVPNGKALLIVDQFEELITLCTDENERTKFLNQLKVAISAHRERLRVVVTLRSDFEPQFDEFESFAESIRISAQTSKANLDSTAGANFIVPAMTPEEYREVIEGPASVKVLYFKGSHGRSSQDFIDRLIGDIANTPGALPLLSFALSELYIQLFDRYRNDPEGSDRALLEDDYEALGGVGGSLRNRAEEIYKNLPDDPHRETMKKVMLRMVSAEGGGLARRRAKREELKYASDAENDRVEMILDQLVSARLVVRDKDEEGNKVLEPAHDKLINGWSRLLEWSRRELTGLQLREILAPAVEDWARDRDWGKLWSDNPRLSLLAEELGLPHRWYQHQIDKLNRSVNPIRELTKRVRKSKDSEK